MNSVACPGWSSKIGNEEKPVGAGVGRGFERAWSGARRNYHDGSEARDDLSGERQAESLTYGFAMLTSHFKPPSENENTTSLSS